MIKRIGSQKTKECTLYGFIIQPKRSLDHGADPTSTPYSKLVEFCKFLQGSHPQARNNRYEEQVIGYAPHKTQRQPYWKLCHFVVKKWTTVKNDGSQVESRATPTVGISDGISGIGAVESASFFGDNDQSS